MAIMYSIFNSENDGSGASLIFSDGTVKTVSSDNPNFGAITNMLLTTPADEVDEDALLALVTPVLAVNKNLTRLSERVSFDGSNILFDGDVLDGAIAEHILRILHEGGSTDSYAALVAFLEKLSMNPSESSRNSLYAFIVRYGITIDLDGDFYAYKGVQADNTSVFSGFGIVNGVSMNGHLPNLPGSILEIPRSTVEANNAIGCGIGLHAGTYEYAQGWSRGVLLTVKINPRDVVSVPTCSTYQKIRTCRYKVVSKVVVKNTATTNVSQPVSTNKPVVPAVDSVKASLKKLANAVARDGSAVASLNTSRGDGSTVDATVLVKEVVTKFANNKEITLVKGEDYTTGKAVTFHSDYINKVSLTASANGATIDAADLDALVADKDGVVIDFDYTTVNGEYRKVENFAVESITGYNKKVAFGVRGEDGAKRSYRLDLMENITVTDAGDVVASTPVAAPVATPVAKPVVPALNKDNFVEAIQNDGATVRVTFDYTKVDGTPRQRVTVYADEVLPRGNRTLIAGIRVADFERRNYRLDLMDIMDVQLASDADVAFHKSQNASLAI